MRRGFELVLAIASGLDSAARSDCGKRLDCHRPRSKRRRVVRWAAAVTVMPLSPTAASTPPSHWLQSMSALGSGTGSGQPLHKGDSILDLELVRLTPRSLTTAVSSLQSEIARLQSAADDQAPRLSTSSVESATSATLAAALQTKPSIAVAEAVARANPAARRTAGHRAGQCAPRAAACQSRPGRIAALPIHHQPQRPQSCRSAGGCYRRSIRIDIGPMSAAASRSVTGAVAI